MAREGLMDDCGYSFEVNEDDWNDGFKAGFLMAVDEFAEKLKEKSCAFSSPWSDEYTIVLSKEIDKIAEQLKEE